MTNKEIVEMQFKVLALVDQLETDRNSIEFKHFKHRVFKNIEYIKNKGNELNE